MSAAQSIEILTRPFATWPATGLMLTDGIVVSGTGPVELGVYLVNRLDQALENVVIHAEFDERSAMQRPAAPVRIARMLPQTPTLIVFEAGPVDAAPGLYDLVLDITGRTADGPDVSSRVARRFFVARSEGPHSLAVPEGAINTEILEWTTDSCGARTPSHVRMQMTPRTPFAGQFGPLPFQDPLWKAAGAVATEVGLGGLATAGAAGAVAGTAAGAGVASATNSSTGTAVATGIAVAIVVTGVVLLLLDGEDTFRWGEARTAVDDDEVTVREEIEGRLVSGNRAEWSFTRVTNKRTVTCREIVPIWTSHYTTARRVSVSHDVVDAGQPLEITAEFERDGRVLVGAELYVVAILARAGQVVSTLRLTDAGQPGAGTRGRGKYTGTYLASPDDRGCELEVMVAAQDVNDADPRDPPIEQAKRLGGILVSAPRMHEGRLIPDARVTVCRAEEPAAVAL